MVHSTPFVMGVLLFLGAGGPPVHWDRMILLEERVYNCSRRGNEAGFPRKVAHFPPRCLGGYNFKIPLTLAGSGEFFGHSI